ncbi:hypothetical protein DXG03_002571, partial [Asterophora parasitica]
GTGSESRFPIRKVGSGLETGVEKENSKIVGFGAQLGRGHITASTNAVLRIWLPGRSLHNGSTAKTTTKRVCDASEAESNAEEPLKPMQKQCASKEPKANVASEDVENSMAEIFAIEATKGVKDPVVAAHSLPKHPHGRPPGSGKAKAVPPPLLPHQVPVIHLHASVYVEMSLPPKPVHGCTSKGDKLVTQKPKQSGPFTLTKSMSWHKFLGKVAETAGIEKENIDLGKVTWTFQKPKCKLLLTGEEGYEAMLEQILALKSLLSAIIIVNIPAPKKRKQPEE